MLSGRGGESALTRDARYLPHATGDPLSDRYLTVDSHARGEERQGWTPLSNHPLSIRRIGQSRHGELHIACDSRFELGARHALVVRVCDVD